MPNFIESGQTSLEIGDVNWASDKKNYFVTDRQKRDYLSRASQCARGATKMKSMYAQIKLGLSRTFFLLVICF